MEQHAEFNWVGLLFIAGALAYNFWNALRRGKVESEDQATQPRPPVPTSSPTAPAPKKPLSGKSLEDLFEELSRGLEPEPTVPPPRPAPPVYQRPPPFIRVPEPQSPQLQDDPAGLVARAGAALYSTAVERMDNPTEETPITTRNSQDSDRFAWLRQRLANREETQRCIILNEVFQAPVAFR